MRPLRYMPGIHLVTSQERAVRLRRGAPNLKIEGGFMLPYKHMISDKCGITILELQDGSFFYAGGNPVKERADLGILPDSFRERAEAWFDAFWNSGKPAPEEVVKSEEAPVEEEEVSDTISDTLLENSRKGGRRR